MATKFGVFFFAETYSLSMFSKFWGPEHIIFQIIILQQSFLKNVRILSGTAILALTFYCLQSVGIFI